MKPRKVVAAILLLIYPVAVHSALLSAHHELAVLALLLLCASFAVLFGLKDGRASWSVAVIVVVSAVVAAGLLNRSSLPVVLFPLLINVALCLLFGRTLVRGREALITRFARLEEHDLSPGVIRYTRSLTLFWCIVFAALAVELVLLAVFASPGRWSLFANFLNYLFVVALFALEYAYRRWRFRYRPHKSPMQFFTSLAKVDWVQLSLR